jgi:hypothetical protein
MGGLDARVGKIEKSNFLQKSDFWGEVNLMKISYFLIPFNPSSYPLLPYSLTPLFSFFHRQ